MVRRKHYVYVDDTSISVRPVTEQLGRQVMSDLGMLVKVVDHVTRNGLLILYPAEDPDSPFPIELFKPALARKLVAAGAFSHKPTDWDVRAGLWIFGPGRGWCQDEAEEEAQRLLLISTDLDE
jgi:hypothetical protein